MSLIETLEEKGHEALTAVEHAAAWLVGKVATADVSLHALEASSPLVAEAIAMGEASARAHGIPIDAIENVGEAVLDAAKALAAGLSQPAPEPAPEGAAT